MIRLTEAEMLFLVALEKHCTTGKRVQIGNKDSVVSAAIQREYGVSRSYISMLLTQIKAKGALERVGKGVWRIKVPADKCGRTEGRVGRKWTGFKRVEPDIPDEPPPPPRALPPVPPEHPTLTGRLMGDPLPGRSALDKIRRGEA